MIKDAQSPKEYLASLPEDKRAAVAQLRAILLEHLPEGFQETINYGMLGYVVPHDLFPPGYHCDPDKPLPFIHLAAQKNYIALYHMGLYADPDLLHWFKQEYPRHTDRKLDMGKSCIRFKKPEHIPFTLIAELCRRVTAQEWIDQYESMRKR